MIWTFYKPSLVFLTDLSLWYIDHASGMTVLGYSLSKTNLQETLYYQNWSNVVEVAKITKK